MIEKTSIIELKTEPKWKTFILDNLGLAYREGVELDSLYSGIKKALDSLNDNLWVVIETDYVDKDYRDCYYHFYATKLKDYGRNCIRLSFFDNGFDIINTLPWNDPTNFKKTYRGFMVLRPLVVGCIGRNVISTMAKKNFYNGYEIIQTSVPASCMGIKLESKGFPHSSQDGELLTCAETTIWSIMQYFGYKYPEYTPELPHQIIDSLKEKAMSRLTPSEGLTYYMISAALMTQGFGCKVYDNKNPIFKELIGCYINSGIPLALALVGSGYGHAVVCIGHKNVDKKALGRKAPNRIYGKDLYLINRHIDFLVVNNDNVPSYQLLSYLMPVARKRDVRIATFIAPLYPKIYMDATIAIAYSNWIVGKKMKIEDGSVVKTFLASSRSYRNYLMLDSGLPDDLKDFMLDIDLPKFVWVTEVSNYNSFLNDRVNSLILLDATGNISALDPEMALLYIQNDNNIVIFNRILKKFQKIFVNLPLEFEKYNGNIQP